MDDCNELVKDAHTEHLKTIKFVWNQKEKIAMCEKQIGFMEEGGVNDIAIDELYEKKEGKILTPKYSSNTPHMPQSRLPNTNVWQP